jgi:cystathionine beta-lyase family protein involved in aluminum resistance
MVVLMNKLISEAEDACQKEFKHIEEIELLNSKKVMDAFKAEELSQSDFVGTTGYGYDDIGRDKIERIFARVLGSEDAIVRNQFVSGSHALNVTFFALLRPNDLLLSITGKPYDTMDSVIGTNNNPSSLKAFGVKFDKIELVNNDFDYDAIKKYLNNHKVKVIEIQRSKGYSTRYSLTIDKVEKVIKFIKNIDNNIIVMVDNCYCEFVDTKEPTAVGADIMVGSLIKNLGAGMASNGAYVAGRKDLINLVGERLTLPGEGRDVGPSLGANKSFALGLYFAPSVVASSVKIAVLTSYIMAKLGYKVEPKYDEPRADIVESIIFNDRDKLIKYCQIIQKNSPVDSNANTIPGDMPGYDDQVIMASGSFTSGSSIELSCDGPLREPYIAYMQGGLTYDYGKLALDEVIDNFK